jgi:hypothetical protein
VQAAVAEAVNMTKIIHVVPLLVAQEVVAQEVLVLLAVMVLVNTAVAEAAVDAVMEEALVVQVSLFLNTNFNRSIYGIFRTTR